MDVFPSLSYKFESYFFSMNKRLEISVEFNEEGEKKERKKRKGKKNCKFSRVFLEFQENESLREVIASSPTSLRSSTWNDSRLGSISMNHSFIVTLLTNYRWRSHLSIITGKRPSQVNIRDIVAQMLVTYPHANHRVARVGISFGDP